MPACAHCAAPDAPLICTGCLAALYCAAACQRAARPAHAAACDAANAQSPRDAEYLETCSGCGAAVAAGAASDDDLICHSCRSVKYCSAECMVAHDAAHAPGCAAAATMLFTAAFNLAEAGDAEALKEVGSFYDYGRGDAIPIDKAEAVRWYYRAAMAGNIGAMGSLGHAFEYGHGTPINLQSAVEWYTRAHEAGIDSRFSLGVLYDKLKNHAKAFDFFMSAASAAYAPGRRMAQSYLGHYYRDGKGVVADAAEAFVWFTRAAEAGEAGAMCALGDIYRFGFGDDGTGKPLAADVATAFSWYMRGAEKGKRGAIGKVGYCYLMGVGVAADEAEAVKWYTRAAAGFFGDPVSQISLATLIHFGAAPGGDKEAMRYYVQAIRSNPSLPASLCWADDFERRRKYVSSYADSLRALSHLSGRSSAGVTAFLAAAERFACVCEKCAIAMD